MSNKKKTQRKYKDMSEYCNAEIERTIAKLPDAQAKKVREYVEFYSNKPSNRGGKVSINSVRNAVTTLKDLGLFIKKPFEHATKKDIIDWVKWLNKKNIKVSGLSTRKVNVRSFYKWLYNIHDPHKFPEIVDDPLLVPEQTKDKKQKQDLPTKEDIIKLVNACYTNKDKCIIMMLAEGGLRCGEIVSLNIGSVEFDENGAKVWIEESKSKRRYERLIETAPYLQTWLQEHPFKQDKNYPLFPSSIRGEQQYKRMLPKSMGWVIKRVSARVPEFKEKKLHPHLLRHFAISTRWKEGMRTESNATRHGITETTLRQVYLHFDDKDVDDEYVELHDVKPDPKKLIEKEQEKKRLAPKKCGFCKTINEFGLNYCKNCNKPIDITTFVEQDRKQEQELNSLKKEMADMPAKILSQLADLPTLKQALKLIAETQKATTK